MGYLKTKVALVSGFWGQNIGNAFFNIGGKWILDQIFKPDPVQFVQDQPAYRTFYNQSKGTPHNYCNLLNDLDVEYIVLQGPMMTSTFRAIWEGSFKEYKKRGIKVILLGAAFFKYTNKEIAYVKEFLDEYPPSIIITRDAKTYSIIKNWISHTFSGLDSAFFVPKAFNPIDFDNKYITFNFDRYPEPLVYINDRSRKNADYEFRTLGHKWNLNVPNIQKYFSHLGKAQAYIGHLLDLRKLPKELIGYKIIRPEHRYTPHMTHKIYQHPNSFVSDETFTYFSIYAGTSLTLSDRVHACVLTLAFGHRAMLFTPSPRKALFERLGLSDIGVRPVKLNLNYLEEERQSEINFLNDTIHKLRNC